MIRTILRSKSGQTTVEYLLLVSVAVTMGIAFYKAMDKHLIKNPNGIIGKPLKSFQEALNQDTSGRYSRFRLRH